MTVIQALDNLRQEDDELDASLSYNSSSCVPVAHACIPSYSVVRVQEDRGSKPAGQIVCETLS
jgi:hypothetical protein